MPAEQTGDLRHVALMRASWLPVQVVLEAEVSRDIVPLRNAYRHVGQKARVRVNGGIEYSLSGAPRPSSWLAPWRFVQGAAPALSHSRHFVTTDPGTGEAPGTLERRSYASRMSHAEVRCHSSGSSRPQRGVEEVTHASLSPPPAVARGPFPQQLNRDALFKARGDMHAGEIKAVKEAISVRQELPLLVSEGAAPEVYKAAADDAFEVGPFEVRWQRALLVHPAAAE